MPDLRLNVKLALHKCTLGFIVAFIANKMQFSIRPSVKRITLVSYCLARQRSVACELRPLTVRVPVVVRHHSHGICKGVLK